MVKHVHLPTSAQNNAADHNRKLENSLDSTICNKICAMSIALSINTLICDVSTLVNMRTLDLSYCERIRDVNPLSNINKLFF